MGCQACQEHLHLGPARHCLLRWLLSCPKQSLSQEQHQVLLQHEQQLKQLQQPSPASHPKFSPPSSQQQASQGWSSRPQHLAAVQTWQVQPQGLLLGLLQGQHVPVMEVFPLQQRAQQQGKTTNQEGLPRRQGMGKAVQ
jgi:hypothetical protein